MRENSGLLRLLTPRILYCLRWNAALIPAIAAIDGLEAVKFDACGVTAAAAAALYDALANHPTLVEVVYGLVMLS